MYRGGKLVVIIRGRWNASGVGVGVRSRPKGVICVFVVVVVGGGVCAKVRVGVWEKKRAAKGLRSVYSWRARGKGVTGTRAAVVQLSGGRSGRRKRKKPNKEADLPTGAKTAGLEAARVGSQN
jgi:hypothetical protein